jgi:hypothetical protein
MTESIITREEGISGYGLPVPTRHFLPCYVPLLPASLTQLCTKPHKIVSKSSHCVVLMRGVAFAVSTKIDRNDAVRVTEELCLGRK